MVTSHFGIISVHKVPMLCIDKHKFWSMWYRFFSFNHTKVQMRQLNGLNGCGSGQYISSSLSPLLLLAFMLAFVWFFIKYLSSSLFSISKLLEMVILLIERCLLDLGDIIIFKLFISTCRCWSSCSNILRMKWGHGESFFCHVSLWLLFSICNCERYFLLKIGTVEWFIWNI
jgi:hypothetical protein